MDKINTLFPEFYSSSKEEGKGNSSRDKDKELRELQKMKNFGVEYCETAMKCGKYGMPLVKPYYGNLPKHYVSISSPNCLNPQNTCITGFDYDYILEGVWRNPRKYADLITSYQCFGSIDFSMRVDNPLCVQIANAYRSNCLSFFYQEMGGNLFPAPHWSSSTSYDFCFDGFSKGGAVLVSTIGTHRDERSMLYFKDGFFEMLKRLDPDVVVMYGVGNRDKYPWLPASLEVVFVLPERFERARRNGR